MTNPVSEERLRNTRAWAAARVGSLSGADVIVGAIDELLELRQKLWGDTFVTAEPPGNVEVVKYPDPPYQLLGDSGQIECPMCAGEGRVTPPSPNRGG